MSSKWARENGSSEIMVKGGARGLTVEYRELEAVAGILDDSVSELTNLRAGCTEIYLLLNGTSAVHAHAHQAVDAAEHVIRGLQRNMEELQEAASALRKAAVNYLEAEGRIEDMLPPLIGMTIWNARGSGIPDRGVTDMVVPAYSGIGIEVLLHLLEGGKYGKLRPIDVEKVHEAPEMIEIEGTARQLLARSKKLLDENALGGVEILTIDREGTPVRIVTLPGTQDAGTLFVTPNPFDNYGNAEGRAKDSQYVADAVTTALRKAGAVAGDEIILVGYSQGGIHAVNTGARLAEAGEFSVEMIITAGGLAGDRDVPPGVKLIHFEHYQDFVTGLDGASNPDTPDRVTVTGNAPVPAGGGPLGPAHELDVYLDMASQADGSKDPSLTEMLGQLAAVIGSGKAATRSLYKFSRKPDAKPPAKAPSKPPAKAPAKPPARPPIGPISPGKGTSPLPLPGHVPPVLVDPVAPIKVPPVVAPIPVPPVVPPGR